MPVELTDSQIAQLLGEKKKLPDNYRERLLQMKEKRGHKESEIDVKGESGGVYRLILRKSNSNMLDFSVILAYEMPNSNKIFRLRRYNGKHRHTNHLEKQTIYDFHIHQATERYQQLGSDEDRYASASSTFSNIETALDRMIDECNFLPPEGERLQISLELQ